VIADRIRRYHGDAERAGTILSLGKCKGWQAGASRAEAIRIVFDERRGASSRYLSLRLSLVRLIGTLFFVAAHCCRPPDRSAPRLSACSVIATANERLHGAALVGGSEAADRAVKHRHLADQTKADIDAAD
jgi:hypothetical protein